MTQILIDNFEYMMKARERLIAALIAGCLILGAAYVYFVARTTVNAVATRSAENALSAENADLSALSAKYVALSGNINLGAALAAGYDQTPVSAFISVPGTGAVAAGGSAITLNAF